MARKSQGLNEKHFKILDLLQKYQDDGLAPPSVREIGEQVDITSTSVVNYYLEQLEKWSYIERDRKFSKGFIVKESRTYAYPNITQPNRKLRVFLCHATQDKPAVLELYKRLAAESWIEPWLDKDKILPGQQWQVVIEEAVECADAVIVFLSNHSVQKEGFVQRELRYATVMALEKPESTIFLIPMRLEDCPVPRSLRDLQWVNYFGTEKDDSYESLLQALKLRCQQVLEYEKRERARLELEEQIRKETEAHVRAEYEAHEKARQAAEQKRSPTISIFEPPTGRIDNPTYLNRQILNGNVPSLLGMEFCRIPSGKFLMGSVKNEAAYYDDEIPQHTVEIPYDYWLARFPVTNAQYAEYAQAAGKKHPVDDWQKRSDHPVTRVSWNDALAYCEWLNDLLKGQLSPEYILRLPTEAEWEKAARGPSTGSGDGRIYPWGDTFDKNKCNIRESGISGTTPVGKYSPQGDSPYGCADLSGNVWEWTHSLFKPYPYKADDGREDEKSSGNRVLRGGSWAISDRSVRCAYRDSYPIDYLDVNGGFRMVASPALL